MNKLANCCTCIGVMLSSLHAIVWVFEIVKIHDTERVRGFLPFLNRQKCPFFKQITIQEPHLAQEDIPHIQQKTRTNYFRTTKHFHSNMKSLFCKRHFLVLGGLKAVTTVYCLSLCLVIFYTL